MRQKQSRRWDGHTYGFAHEPQPPVSKRVNHRLHLILTLLTGGAWGVLVWWWQPLRVRLANSWAKFNYAGQLATYHETQPDTAHGRRRRSAGESPQAARVRRRQFPPASA